MAVTGVLARGRLKERKQQYNNISNCYIIRNFSSEVQQTNRYTQVIYSKGS